MDGLRAWQACEVAARGARQCARTRTGFRPEADDGQFARRKRRLCLRRPGAHGFVLPHPRLAVADRELPLHYLPPAVHDPAFTVARRFPAPSFSSTFLPSFFLLVLYTFFSCFFFSFFFYF